jgi:hypothetical protein
MKKLLFLTLFTFIGLLAQAQLANSKWNGSLNIPELAPAALNFKTDTLEVIYAENGEILETMSYKVSGDTLLLKKISGGSPCPDGSAFKVKYSIQQEKLIITPLSDDCTMRSDSWTKEPFVRAKT